MARAGVIDTYGAGRQTIDQWVASLRSLPEMVDASVPQIANFLLAEMQTAASAGRCVDGTVWPPKKDGGQPLVNAASAIKVFVSGRTIVFQISGHYVVHQFGTTRMPRRPILPMGGMPDRLGNAIRKGLVQMTQEWLTRKGRKSFGGGGFVGASM